MFPITLRSHCLRAAPWCFTLPPSLSQNDSRMQHSTCNITKSIVYTYINYRYICNKWYHDICCDIYCCMLYSINVYLIYLYVYLEHRIYLIANGLNHATLCKSLSCSTLPWVMFVCWSPSALFFWLQSGGIRQSGF